MLAIHARVLLGFYRRRAQAEGIGDGHTGSVTVIQRFGGGLNLNVHFHTLVLDGVFAEDGPGTVRFHEAPAPTDEEVAGVVARVRAQVGRLLARRGLDPAGDEPRDPVGAEAPVLAGISSASVLGRIALGRRAGARVWRLGGEPDAPWVASQGPRQAHVDGFDLHANLAVPSGDRRRLEQLCRYLLRPAVAQERLRVRADGRVVVTLKRAWADGTRELLFEPLELLEKLAALTPQPRVNLIIYHGVLAAHSRWRRRIVPRVTSEPTAGAMPSDRRDDQERVAGGTRAWPWADLLRRAFEIDVLACPRCGGGMRVMATISSPF